MPKRPANGISNFMSRLIPTGGRLALEYVRRLLPLRDGATMSRLESAPSDSLVDKFGLMGAFREAPEQFPLILGLGLLLISTIAWRGSELHQPPTGTITGPQTQPPIQVALPFQQERWS